MNGRWAFELIVEFRVASIKSHHVNTLLSVGFKQLLGSFYMFFY